MDPWFITGFTDAEGSFVVSVLKSKTTKTGWYVNVRYKITLHIKDLEIIKSIQEFFAGKGNIVISKDTCTFRVDCLKDIIDIIIPHFDKYPLITQKLADYILFKEVVYIMNSKKHLKMEGLMEVLSFKAGMNLGLSKSLVESFPDVCKKARPLIINKDIPNPYWMSGFVSGVRSWNFSLVIRANNEYKAGYRTDIVFEVSQHLRDKLLLQKFISFFNCGCCALKKDSRNSTYSFKVSNHADIIKKIVPFFQTYSIEGVKALDFMDWIKGVEIVKSKNHLTVSGLNELQTIKGNMNTRRNINEKS